MSKVQHRGAGAARAVALGVLLASVLALAGGVTAPGTALASVRATSARIAQLAAGHAHECATLTSDAVECWGWNLDGQLGDGTTTSSATPVLVHGLHGVRQLALGFGHSCALLDAGTVECWGWNTNGQLGNGTETSSTTPVVVKGLSGVEQLAAGFAHTCALLATGKVECWGWNFYGQLGDGTHSTRELPTPVRGIAHVARIAAGFGDTCAVLARGTVACWGWDADGELGNGRGGTWTTPQPVRGLTGARDVALGYASSCALRAGGAVVCWGRNNDGQLGDGSTRPSRVPVAVRGLGRAAQVAVGFAHACARLDAGTVECWGFGQDGQLGTGGRVNRPAPRATGLLRGVLEVTAQDDSTCALLRQRVFSCWGLGHDGELGNGLLGGGPVHDVLRPPYLPMPPRSITVRASGADADVRWLAPSSPGAGEVTSYVAQARDLTIPTNGGQECRWRGGPLTCTIRGLTFGDRYRVFVTTETVIGHSPAGASGAVVPARSPDAPTAVAAVAANASARVTWSAPGFNGGSPVQSYTVTAADVTTSANGGETCTWLQGPLACTVTGLTNGDSYTFRVAARNRVGLSASSPPSSSVTPATLPGAPSGVSATPGNAQARVTWSAPASDGGAAVTAYTVRATDTTTSANGNETCGWSTGPLACTVTALTNGDDYTFTVTATNRVGTSGASPASLAVTPATVPAAPRNASATPGDATADVTWSAPSSDGGSAITGYTVTATDHTHAGNGNETCTWSSGPLGCNVDGLTNGDTYSFTVTATNGQGTSAASAASNDVVPAGLPGVPGNVTAVGGDSMATVNWTAAAPNGSAVISYVVTATDSTNSGNGGETCTWTAGPLSCTFAGLDGLTNGDSYTFTVVAINGVGQGSASSPSNAVTPATTPGAPSDATATPDATPGGITVTWTAADDGGSPITSYTVSADDVTVGTTGVTTCTWSGGPLSCDVTGLASGDTYQFEVSATNDAGTGPVDLSNQATAP